MPEKLIEIVREEHKVVIRFCDVPALPYFDFEFVFDAGTEWGAELLKDFINDQISFAFRRALDKAYYAGWRESNIPNYKRHYYTHPLFLEK